MMKLRSKRDRQHRPLLPQEAPMLSDQMPPSTDDGDRSGQVAGRKGGSWKRLFGKGQQGSSSSSNHHHKNNNYADADDTDFFGYDYSIDAAGVDIDAFTNANANAKPNLNTSVSTNDSQNEFELATADFLPSAFTFDDPERNNHKNNQNHNHSDDFQPRKNPSGKKAGRPSSRSKPRNGSGDKNKSSFPSSRPSGKKDDVIDHINEAIKEASSAKKSQSTRSLVRNRSLGRSRSRSRSLTKSRSLLRRSLKGKASAAQQEQQQQQPSSPARDAPGPSPEASRSAGTPKHIRIKPKRRNRSFAEAPALETSANPSKPKPPSRRSLRGTKPGSSSVPASPASASSPRDSNSNNNNSSSSRKSHATLDDVKKVLSKPFGREHILTTEHTWVVHVSRAEWDPEESLWKYRVIIQRREGNRLHDFATCFALRSLEDFYWFEQSLQTEFFGGLLLPSLSIYLGLPDILSCQHEVDPQLLSSWMSDTLNGIRGQGEIMFSLANAEIATCESMEAFLYRTEFVRPLAEAPSVSQNQAAASSGGDARESGWNFFPELCGANCVGLPKPAKEVSACHSPSLGTANTFNLRADSFLEAPVTFDDSNTSLTIHADLLRAERDLIWSWRTRALQTMEKLRILKEQEKFVGVAWKRFAICVSNLFAYEKDIETARLGDSRSRRELQIPYRRLQKTMVDDCLRILTRHKLERATPSIESIYIMLGAYVADLSTVEPSITAYLKGLQKLAAQKSKTELLEKEHQEMEADASAPPGMLAKQIQEGLMVVKKQLASTINDEAGGIAGSAGEERRYRLRQEVQSIENRLLVNETLLKDYMSTVCRTAPVRTSRMIYAFLEKEKEQCKALRDAAVELNKKVNIASKDTLSKMVNRHHIETKEDKETEIKLVHKIVNIGNTKKFVKEGGEDRSEEVEKGVELSFETEQRESEKSKRRIKAMNDCRARIGRWDAKLAMSIMEAVGVNDANVRVEETTRALRTVRKHAINLRENVERCIEGLDVLRNSILQGSMGDIRDVRADFITEIQNLLSYSYVPVGDQPSVLPAALLEREGISISDPAGWRSIEIGSCGNALNMYIESRDSSTEWLLESLGEVLKDYSHRVEAIESFVYMECVGIQLEKHFSQVRASALTAFEKKTDITSAINIATRKKMPVLVKELNEKLAKLGPVVSHTTVKEAKEAHLESKLLKQELHTMAMRRLARARETSTERAIALMTVWTKEEEASSANEESILDALTLRVQESIHEDDLGVYLRNSPARI